MWAKGAGCDKKRVKVEGGNGGVKETRSPEVRETQVMPTGARVSGPKRGGRLRLKMWW